MQFNASEAFAAAWVQFHPEAVYCTYCLCPAFLSSLYSPNIKKMATSLKNTS